MAEKRVVLKHETDIALADAARQRVLAVETHFTLVGPVQAGDDAKQGGLARAGWPQQRDQFARVDVEVDVVEGREGPETLGHLVQSDFHQVHSFATRPSSITLATRVTIASSASSDATANAAMNWYSL